MSIRFATVYRDTYGETQRNRTFPRRMDRDTPLWQLSSVQREKKKEKKRKKTAKRKYPSENSWMLHSEVGDNIYRYILPVYTSILTDLSWKVGVRGWFLSCKWLIYISSYFHLLSVLHSSKFLRWIVQFIELSCSPFLISNASYFYSRYF